jgi:ribosome-binding factor A
MKPFTRSDRVGVQIQKVLARLLAKDIKDPRLKMITITAVKMSGDLKSGRVYYVAPGRQKAKEGAGEGFNKASGYIKRALAERLGLRYMPELKFFYDDSFDYGSRIDEILKSIKTTDSHDT